MFRDKEQLKEINCKAFILLNTSLFKWLKDRCNDNRRGGWRHLEYIKIPQSQESGNTSFDITISSLSSLVPSCLSTCNWVHSNIHAIFLPISGIYTSYCGTPAYTYLPCQHRKRKGKLHFHLKYYNDRKQILIGLLKYSMEYITFQLGSLGVENLCVKCFWFEIYCGARSTRTPYRNLF